MAVKTPIRGVFDGSTALLFLNSIKDKLENHSWVDDLN